MARIEKNIKRPWIVKSEPKRNREHDKFYDSPEWRRLRKVKLCQDPLCEASKQNNLIVPGKEIDHIRPRRLFPELSLDLDNLMTLSTSMHSKKSALEKDIHTREDWNKAFKDKDTILHILTRK